eukprot:8256058-Prorocentrum_lima.AAC.1
MALGAIANCAEDKRTHRGLAESGNALHELALLMRSRHVAVAREAARGVANLLSTRATHALFLESDGVRSLTHASRAADNEM